MNITWLGHSAFHITDGSTNILLDPFLSGNPSAPDNWRNYTKNVDYILLTHGHADHVGDTVQIAKETGATVVGIYDLTSWLTTQGVANVDGLNKGGGVDLAPGLRVTLTHAFHSSSYEQDGQQIYLGEAASFIINFAGQTIYAAGDTDIFSDMALIQKLYAPNVGLIPIGDHFTMSPTTAAYACNEFLNLDYIFPIHHGTFPALTGTVSEFTAKVKRGQVVETTPGQTHTFKGKALAA